MQIWALAAGALLFGCGGASGQFTEPVSAAEAPALYEGVSRQMPQEALEEARRTRTVHDLHGASFHREALALSAEDGKRLTQLLSAQGTYRRFRGGKKCGGFHADYLLEWQRGGVAYQALICFSCHEAMLFGPGIDERHDLDDKAYAELELLLPKYRKHAPEGAP